MCVLDLVKRVERRPRESVLGQVGSGLVCLMACLMACLLLATQAEVLVCAAHVPTPSWSALPAQEFAAAVRFLNQRLPPRQDVHRVQYTAFGAPACCCLVAWSGWWLGSLEWVAAQSCGPCLRSTFCVVWPLLEQLA